MIHLPTHHERKLNSASSSFRSTRLRHNDSFERIDNWNILLVRARSEVVWPVTDTIFPQPTSVAARSRFLVCLYPTLRPGKVFFPVVFSKDYAYADFAHPSSHVGCKSSMYLTLCC